MNMVTDIYIYIYMYMYIEREIKRNGRQTKIIQRDVKRKKA